MEDFFSNFVPFSEVPNFNNKIKGCLCGLKTKESSLSPHADKNQTKRACRRFLRFDLFPKVKPKIKLRFKFILPSNQCVKMFHFSIQQLIITSFFSIGFLSKNASVFQNMCLIMKIVINLCTSERNYGCETSILNQL